MKLMILDGNSIVNRAFYGIRMLNAPDGTPTNAVYGFLTIFQRILELEQPQAVCVAFDVQAPISLAVSSRSSTRSQAMTSLAPKVLQALTAVRPMGPQPLTRTVFPATSALSTPWTPAPMGSNRQAVS